jgi:predicted metal-dependent enzyme (double-stranded beta helix superfamily)
MKMRLVLPAILLLGIVIGRAQNKTWPWPDSMEAMAAAGKDHKVLYEDDKVRILEVTVAPGVKEPMHFHRWPSVIIYETLASNKVSRANGEVVVRPRPAADAPYPTVVKHGPEMPHSVENLDTIPFHVYRVEFKHAEFRD